MPFLISPLRHHAAEYDRPTVRPFRERAISQYAGGNSMPKLSTVTQEKARVTIPLGDEELKVTYRPAKMTPRLLEQAQRAESNGNVSAGLLALLSELLVSWDLLDDVDEEPIPITPEGLADVPFVILRRIIEAIGLAMAPAASARNGAGH